MGVSGSGKTVVGERLAKELGYAFRDGDGFHPRANVEKMASGTPLNDDDRWPWLDAIGMAIRAHGNDGIVVACSALRRVYRERIAAAAGHSVGFVFLDGTYATLRERMQSRRGHFMPASLLDSQLATLERPGPDEPAITISVEAPVEEVVRRVIAGLPELKDKIGG